MDASFLFTPRTRRLLRRVIGLPERYVQRFRSLATTISSTQWRFPARDNGSYFAEASTFTIVAYHEYRTGLLERKKKKKRKTNDNESHALQIITVRSVVRPIATDVHIDRLFSRAILHQFPLFTRVKNRSCPNELQSESNESRNDGRSRFLSLASR